MVQNEMKEALRKASEVLGRAKPGRKKQKESWWWSDGVREALKEKKLAFKKWQRTNLDVDREEYKVRKKEAKRAVEIARKEGTQELYDQLGKKEGEQWIYRIAKARHTHTHTHRVRERQTDRQTDSERERRETMGETEVK